MSQHYGCIDDRIGCHDTLWMGPVLQRQCPMPCDHLLHPESPQSLKTREFSHEEAALRAAHSDSAEACRIEQLHLEARKWELERPAREECERKKLAAVLEQNEMERLRGLGINIITASMDGRMIVCTFRNIKCNHCQVASEIGITFRCNVREDYDLCNKCMLNPTQEDRAYTYTRHESPMLQEESCDGEQTLNELPDYSVPRIVHGIDQHAFTDYVMNLYLYRVIKFQAGHLDEDILMHMQHRPYMIRQAQDAIKARPKRHVNRVETSVWDTMQNIDGANLLAAHLAPSASTLVRSPNPQTSVEKACLLSKTNPSSARQKFTKNAPQKVDITPLQDTAHSTHPLPGDGFNAQQITDLLCKYDAQHSNPFEIYENIGLSSEIRCALVAYIDSVRGKTGDDKIEIGRSEIVSILTAAAGREACDHFIANIEGIFPTRDFKIVLRRTESDGVARCIAFHKDDTLYTMAIPLNAPGDKCTGGQLVYLNEAGPSCIARDTDTLTLHDNTILHGISAHTNGVRWGMYLLTPLAS